MSADRGRAREQRREVDDGDRAHGDAEGDAGELALQLRDHEADGLRRAGPIPGHDLRTLGEGVAAALEHEAHGHALAQLAHVRGIQEDLHALLRQDASPRRAKSSNAPQKWAFPSKTSSSIRWS